MEELEREREVLRYVEGCSNERWTKNSWGERELKSISTKLMTDQNQEDDRGESEVEVAEAHI